MKKISIGMILGIFRSPCALACSSSTSDNDAPAAGADLEGTWSSACFNTSTVWNLIA